MQFSQLRKRMPVMALTDPKIVCPAVTSALAKLDPRVMILPRRLPRVAARRKRRACVRPAPSSDVSGLAVKPPR